MTTCATAIRHATNRPTERFTGRSAENRPAIVEVASKVGRVRRTEAQIVAWCTEKHALFAGLAPCNTKVPV